MRSFLEQVALGDALPHVQAEAQQALEEWWLPNARCRPTAQDIAALRAAPWPIALSGDVYRLSVPETFTGSGVRGSRRIARVQTWGGYLCGDAHTVVAVNVTPLDARPWRIRSRPGRPVSRPRVAAIDRVPGSRALSGSTG